MSRGSTGAHHIGAERIRAIDPLRGFAMVLVVAQHAYHFVAPQAATGLANTLVYGTTRMASVAFMSVSGMMIGYFILSARAGVSRRTPDDVVCRFRRRALFLLVVAHPAIQLASIANLDRPELGMAGQLVHRLLFDFPITDTIALCLLIAPPLLVRLRAPSVAILSGALLVVTVLALIGWQPAGLGGRVLQSALFGSLAEEPPISVGWPLAPWLAIFLLGSLAGGLLARGRRGEASVSDLVGRLVRAAAWLLVIGLASLAAYLLLRAGLTGSLDERVFRAVYPDRTTGLLPIYLAALAGLLALGLATIDGRGHYDRVLWALSVFGRTSLFTYVVQFVFVHSLPAALGLRQQLDLAGVAVVAASALVATWLCAYAYGRLRGWIAADDYAGLCRLGGQSPLVPPPPPLATR